jgi:hypothetical protein
VALAVSAAIPGQLKGTSHDRFGRRIFTNVSGDPKSVRPYDTGRAAFVGSSRLGTGRRSHEGDAATQGRAESLLGLREATFVACASINKLSCCCAAHGYAKRTGADVSISVPACRSSIASAETFHPCQVIRWSRCRSYSCPNARSLSASHVGLRVSERCLRRVPDAVIES